MVLGCQRRNDGSLNVVLVLVDTLRADHLGAYGYSRPTSPALDRLAAESVLFTTARSQSACTFPSVNSLITSRHPIDFLGQPERRIGIPEDIPSLPEILSAHGYRTVAVSASPIVRKTPTKFNPHGGYHRGFDIFDEDCHRESARCLNEKSSRYLDELQHAQPFFLYPHYYGPHAPYSPPVDYQRQFGSHYAGRKGFIRRGDPWTIQSRIYREKVPHRVTDEDVQHLVDLYDDEIVRLPGHPESRQR